VCVSVCVWCVCVCVYVCVCMCMCCVCVCVYVCVYVLCVCLCVCVCVWCGVCGVCVVCVVCVCLCVSFRAEHSTVSDTLHGDQLRVSVFAAIGCFTDEGGEMHWFCSSKSLEFIL